MIMVMLTCVHQVSQVVLECYGNMMIVRLETLEEFKDAADRKLIGDVESSYFDRQEAFFPIYLYDFHVNTFDRWSGASYGIPNRAEYAISYTEFGKAQGFIRNPVWLSTVTIKDTNVNN